jgi:hypothetical protein
MCDLPSSLLGLFTSMFIKGDEGTPISTFGIYSMGEMLIPSLHPMKVSKLSGSIGLQLLSAPVTNDLLHCSLVLGGSSLTRANTPLASIEHMFDTWRCGIHEPSVDMERT